MEAVGTREDKQVRGFDAGACMGVLQAWGITYTILNKRTRLILCIPLKSELQTTSPSCCIVVKWLSYKSW
jgi:hypothetical protein